MIGAPRLSICLDDLRLEVRAALDQARAMGFRAVDASAQRGPISPEQLSRSAQRHLLKHCGDLGLRLASLRGPCDGRSYADPAAGERRLHEMLRIVELAAALGVPVVSTTVGQASAEGGASEQARLREALSILADMADRTGVVVALETSGIAAEKLNQLLATIGCPSLAACCDSGAMIMQGEDPHNLSRLLPGRVRLVRARDAVAGAGSGGSEVPMGTGQLDVPRFLADLEEAGFSGDIVLTRTGGTSSAADILRARQQFEKHLRGL